MTTNISCTCDYCGKVFTADNVEYASKECFDHESGCKNLLIEKFWKESKYKEFGAKCCCNCEYYDNQYSICNYLSCIKGQDIDIDVDPYDVCNKFERADDDLLEEVSEDTKRRLKTNKKEDKNG